jgi:hypothetical protein
LRAEPFSRQLGGRHAEHHPVTLLVERRQGGHDRAAGDRGLLGDHPRNLLGAEHRRQLGALDQQLPGALRVELARVEQ